MRLHVALVYLVTLFLLPGCADGEFSMEAFNRSQLLPVRVVCGREPVEVAAGSRKRVYRRGNPKRCFLELKPHQAGRPQCQEGG